VNQPRRRRRSISLFLALGLVATLAPVTAVPTSLAEEHLTTGSDVVISQVYGGGGNSGADYTHDFIELFNRGVAPVDLTGWSVQYASATGSSWQVTPLSGTLQPGQYYLIQQAQGAGGTTPLPTPDATGTIAMSATNGKVALVEATTALTGTCPTAGVIDFVGFGSTANCFEGSGPTPTLNNSTAALRVEAGCQDTDDNAADFELVNPPTPRNTASPLTDCDAVPPPPPPPPPPADAPVVISQVYGGGGNSGADYTHDFIELFNRGAAPVDLTGWSVQYASATGSSWQVTPLSGTLQPGQYYLIQQAQGAGGTTPLPTPDATGTIAMSATNGKVALVEATTALTGTCPTAGVIDFVGYGSTANCSESSAPTPPLSNTTAAHRVFQGCVDTGHNANDFFVAEPDPRNTASPFTECAAVAVSQVYGGGGNSGADYTHDFIELFNRGAAPVDLTGWSVQYASATGSSWQVTPLSGTLQPGQYYLIQQAQGAGGTTPLPTPDATGTIAMSATNGKVALVEATTALTGTCPTAGVIDFVGFGSTANCFEGSGPTPTLNNSTAALRVEAGCQDTDDNAADFELVSPPTPRNTANPLTDCTEEPPPPVLVCNAPPEISPISMVQGPGDVTPCSGELVIIEGVVVGDYQGSSPNLRGFYVQSRDDDWDDDPETSEGIFVFNFDNIDVALGDLVRVTGVAAEFQGQTQLNFPESIEILDSGWTVTLTDVELPFESHDYLERYEGMLVRFPQELYVTEFFQLGRFGQIVVSSGNRLAQPTNVVDPGPDANELQAVNDLNRIIFDDHYNIQNPDPILFGRGGNELTAENTLRGGDTVEGAVGVLTYGWGGNAASPNAYRMRVVGDPAMIADLEYAGSLPGDFDDVVPVFQPTNPRPESAPEVGGSVRVASFNVLNYFLTLDVFGSPTRSTACGPEGDKQACRGANTALELERQRAKLLQALVKLDADVVGLIELENSEGVEPMADIVDGPQRPARGRHLRLRRRRDRRDRRHQGRLHLQARRRVDDRRLRRPRHQRRPALRRHAQQAGPGAELRRERDR
jgi:predicted extracellular nuclease